MTPNDGGPAPQDRTATTSTASTQVDNRDRSALVSSQQAAWWPVHQHIVQALEQVGSWPMVGTPAWCALDDQDPAKLAALLDAAQHWALRLETCQQARCDASREISAAGDWSALRRRIFVRTCFYDARPWLKRVAP